MQRAVLEKLPTEGLVGLGWTGLDWAGLALTEQSGRIGFPHSQLNRVAGLAEVVEADFEEVLR